MEFIVEGKTINGHEITTFSGRRQIVSDGGNMIPIAKECPTCGTLKLIESFRKTRNGKRIYNCKPCENEARERLAKEKAESIEG